MSLYVVGVGPWDPDLVTVKAVKVLSTVDVVFYGSLVNEEVIERYAPRARRVFMGHVDGRAHEGYVDEAIRMAKAGLKVAFLKNGDPTLFGRGIEICLKARVEGVHCEVIPGVSSFTTLAARHLIDFGRVIMLASYPYLEMALQGHVDSIVVFMAGRYIKRLDEILGRLDGRFTALVASRLTYPDETVIEASGPVNVNPPTLLLLRRRG